MSQSKKDGHVEMHEQRLKKTFFAVDLGYEHSCDTIGAMDAKAAIANDTIILRFALKPSGENQHIDEDYLHFHPLKYIQITDEHVLQGFRKFVRNHSEASMMQIEITSKGKTLPFRVANIDSHGEHFLQLSFA